MKKCTGENCPMQVGYDVEKCAAIEACLKCGNYTLAHEGSCNGCRWRR